jgi:hypothetical protein
MLLVAVVAQCFEFVFVAAGEVVAAYITFLLDFNLILFLFMNFMDGLHDVYILSKFFRCKNASIEICVNFMVAFVAKKNPCFRCWLFNCIKLAPLTSSHASSPFVCCSKNRKTENLLQDAPSSWTMPLLMLVTG